MSELAWGSGVLIALVVCVYGALSAVVVSLGSPFIVSRGHRVLHV